MKKILLGLLFFITVFFSQRSLFCGYIPAVLSRNGFSCSSDANVVNCWGSFPGHRDSEINAIGLYTVIIFYTDNVSRERWSYSSETGCLCKTNFDAIGDQTNSQCISGFGRKKAFNWPKGKDKMSVGALLGSWCEKN